VEELCWWRKTGRSGYKRKHKSDQQLYRLASAKDYPRLKECLKRPIHQQKIVRQWEEMVRMVGSLKTGWVAASLFISKLQSFPRQNSLTEVMQEYGKLCKTIFILKYVLREEYQRHIEVQLNKGENLHSLREHIFFAQHGQIRKIKLDQQTNQAGCLNLVTNAVVLWNTVYMWEAAKLLRAEGHQVLDEELVHTWPSRFEHLNVYGKYLFKIPENQAQVGLRPLLSARQVEEAENL
jgi:TnpA family transposase